MSQSETKRSSDYTYQVKRILSAEERQALAEKHSPKLFELTSRYLPDFDISNGVPLRPEFLDVLRGGWLLDKENDKPDYADIVSGVGYAFGLLLEERLKMKWCLIEDNMGEDISMIKFQEETEKDPKEVSIPPFNYVAKRKEIQNVEVFCDGMSEFEKLYG
jgi:hypothetical protein